MTLSELQEWRERVKKTLALRLGHVPKAGKDQIRKREVLVCAGGACVSCGCSAVTAALKELVNKMRLGDHVKVVDTGCVGCCDLGVVVQIMPDNVLYTKVTPASAKTIAERHLLKNELVTELLPVSDRGEPYKSPAEMPFFKHQLKVVLENCGLIDPQSIDEYVARDGYAALAKVLGEMEPAEVVKEVTASGLRGRGGGGFPTGRKWGMLAGSKSPTKYIICNGDEGDPGAFMDRSVLESDPHRVLEGMLIAGYATGAHRGVLYVRAEYPLAIKRLQIAIQHARENGLLGERVLGTDFNFDVEIRVGAGAFVCGEETALIASVEGRRGMPKPRPPFPTQAGLYGQPTIINNVETFANIAPIIRKGGEWYAKIGSPSSPGTKVFALAGKVNSTGLVEVPTGMTLRKLVYEIAGGVPDGKKFKAAQTGGPSGGCIPANHLDTPMDFDSLQKIGSIMGSGGLIVMDETSCMVDVARFFMDFCVDESCGKCPPCRVGTKQMLGILTRFTEGQASENDLAQLEELAGVVSTASLCGLGMTAPNPARSTLQHFREEYEAHIEEKRCPAGACRNLMLAPCENQCPLHMNIPAYLQLLNENRLEDAFEMVIMDNPLPAITGRVCQHPCQPACRRATVDEPVGTRDVHRYIADTIYKKKLDGKMVERVLARKLPDTGKSIAIVGAGPGGLAAAFYLALLGHQVTVYDAEPDAGGLLRYAIPEYRIPRSIMDTELQFIRKLGVKFVFNTPIGKEKKLEALAAENDAVFVATGAGLEVSPGVDGEKLKGVYSAIDFLDEVCKGKKVNVGKKVVVIGGGNSAIDSARTALRLGADVTVAYRRERADMPAIPDEVKDAEQEGVKFVFLCGIKGISGNGKVTGIEAMKMTLGDFDSSGRRKAVPTGETYEIPCDSVILAVGEKVNPAIVKESGVQTARDGRVTAHRVSQVTANPKIYAGGDMVLGPANVTLAMGQGKKAAEAIDIKLTGQKRFASLFRKIEYKNTVPYKPEGGHKNEPAHKSVAERRSCFQEVSLGLSDSQARTESTRCLRCDIKTAEVVEQ